MPPTTSPAAPVLSIVPKDPDPDGSISYTQHALNALDEARVAVMKADKEGKPVTHLVVCMVSEYVVGKEQRCCSHHVSSALTSDLAMIGVLELIKHDFWG